MTSCAAALSVLPSTLDIQRLWDGPTAPPALHSALHLEVIDAGLHVTTEAPTQPEPRLPDAMPGCRVADLWRYDVVELFLAGASTYLEIELGPEGRFLALSFDGPRQLRDEHTGWRPAPRWGQAGDRWWASLTVPHAMIPPDLVALNGYAILSGIHLAWRPLPGPKPDFHQPTRFPRLTPPSP